MGLAKDNQASEERKETIGGGYYLITQASRHGVKPKKVVRERKRKSEFSFLTIAIVLVTVTKRNENQRASEAGATLEQMSGERGDVSRSRSILRLIEKGLDNMEYEKYLTEMSNKNRCYICGATGHLLKGVREWTEWSKNDGMELVVCLSCVTNPK